MAKDAWRAQLVAEVPRAEIPDFLVDLQGLVAFLRQHRDNLTVPPPDQVAPHVTDALRARPRLVLDYIGDERYRDVVSQVLTG